MDFRVFVEPQQGASYSNQLAVAQTAEALGFSAFFRSDHYVAMSGDGLPGPTDSWVTLGGIARETSSIRLGTLVTSATFRHPGPLAVSVAQVDEMSNGRVEFGIGTGWFEREHAAYASSKAALEGLSNTVAQEYAGYNIRSLVLSPGLLDAGLGLELDRQLHTQKAERSLLGTGDARSIATTVAFLASPAADFMNAVVIRSDGGIRY